MIGTPPSTALPDSGSRSVSSNSARVNSQNTTMAHPELGPGAINELLRYFGPVYQMARTAKEKSMTPRMNHGADLPTAASAMPPA